MNTASPFALLLDVLLKSAALVLIGTALLAALRKTSAANRHAISTAILAALLLLPLTKLLPARWSFALEKPAAPVVNVRLPLIAIASSGSEHAPAQAVENVAQPAPRAPLVIPWKKLAVAVWIAGAALLLARRALIALRLRAIVRGSFPIEDERLAAKVRSLVNGSGVRAEVRESALCPVPVVSGFVRPVVLLPVEAVDWSDAFVSSAMRHELGHIRRRDCITRLLADVLCAFYWMNPLVWFAARQMRLAQEQACDDLVLNSGASADEYAGQLVEVVRSLQGDRFTARHALAMAQPSTLETRVIAIVDESRDRSARSVRGAFAGIAFIAASLALCTAAQLRGADEKKAAPAADANAPLRKQIEIEAKFIEITGEPEGLPDVLKLLDDKPISAASVTGVLKAEQAADAMKTLNNMKGADLLSAPRVTTKSGQRVVIEIVREFRYPTEWDRDAKSGSWTPVKFETKNIGATFSVEAVAEDGVIDMQMTPEVTEFNGWRDLDGDGKVLLGKPDASKPLGKRLTDLPSLKSVPGVEGHRVQPIFTTRKMSATVTVLPQHTVALRILGSGDSDQAKDGGKEPKRQLVVLVTPSIVKPEIIFPKVDFRDSTLREAVEFLALKSKTLDADGQGANIVIRNAENIGDVKITLTLSNVPFAHVLRYVAELANCIVVREEFAFVIEPKPATIAPAANADREDAAPIVPAAPAESAGAAMKKAGAIIFPKIVFDEATLSETVDFLRGKSKALDPDKKGVNLILKPGGADPKITLSLSNVPLSEVLRYVAELAGFEVAADEQAITLRPRVK